MKHLILLTALLTMTFTFGQDKGKGEKREMIKQQKIAFITQEVGFTEKEAEKFWPKYNAMEEETKAHREAKKELKQSMKDIESKSDKEIKSALEKMIKLEKEEVEHKEKFMNDLLEFLPPKKVAKYIAAEHKFKKMLLERLKEHKGKGPGNGGPEK
ncbi:MAG: hypothetical protein R2799_14795 [Crocinitomicaceae bacterium]|nr:hypothetical protein [Crocinitomicaceae bacterium]